MSAATQSAAGTSLNSVRRPSRRFRFNFFSGEIAGLSEGFQREATLVSIFGISTFFWVALGSFHPLDPSGYSQAFPPHTVQNLAGAVGAELAAFSVFFFGAAATLLPLPFLITGLLLVKRDHHAISLGRIFGWSIILGCLSAYMAARVPFSEMREFSFPTGGILGEKLLRFSSLYLGTTGGPIILITSLFTATLLILRKSIFMPSIKWCASYFNSWRQASHAEERRPDTTSNKQDVIEVENEIKNEVQNEIQIETFRNTPEHMPAIEFEKDDARTLLDRFHREETPAIKQKSEPKAAYQAPPVSIFQTASASAFQLSPKELESTANLLVKTLSDFDVNGKIIGFQPGPVVTVFEFQPDAGVKQSKVLGLIDDVALALKVDSIFIHPVPGKRALGIQVPNAKRETVYLGDILATEGFRAPTSPLTFGMGKTISGQPMCADLTSMPHLLMAGATGAGKSVAINALLCSIVMKASPDDVRMILVDPKMLELSVYEGIPHLLMPVITDPQRASLALKWAANEMERRYKLMQHACVRHISGFNQFWEQASPNRRSELMDVMDDQTITKLPYILLVIDELADLMLTAPKDVESSIQRLAQKARASGIHMVLATQRPSVDIITGVIKANLPCRISFQVVSKHDSRTILDQIGAEKLLGKGDMLFQKPGLGRLERIQGALISDEEVLSLVASTKSAAKATAQPSYDNNVMGWIDEELSRIGSENGEGETVDNSACEDDPKYSDAMQVAKTHGVVSASFLQRHLKIGYNRAARIVEHMESRGLVAKADGVKPRRWLGPT